MRIFNTYMRIFYNVWGNSYYFSGMEDRKPAAVKALLEKGQIAEVAHIFDILPKSPTYKKMKMGYDRFIECLNSPGEFSLLELSRLADVIGIDDKVIIDIAYKNMKTRRKT